MNSSLQHAWWACCRPATRRASRRRCFEVSVNFPTKGKISCGWQRCWRPLQSPPLLWCRSSAGLTGLDQDTAIERAVRRTEVEPESVARRTRRTEALRMVHVLVSRTMRFHDTNSTRRKALRRAVVASLTEALVPVSDIRHHDKVAGEIQHARALTCLNPRR